MTAGTNASRVRSALATLLAAELGSTAVVSYSAPVNPDEQVTAAGTIAAVWTATRSADVETPVLGGGVLWLDETVTVEVVAQVLDLAGGAQVDVDEAAEDLLGAVIATIRNAPDLALTGTDGEVQTFDVVPVGWTADAGVIGDNPSHRGARFVLSVEATARLNLSTS
jgi:hypothetical protein